jgi:ABC-2 type transport system ATP-binding protein
VTFGPIRPRTTAEGWVGKDLMVRSSRGGVPIEVTCGRGAPGTGGPGERVVSVAVDVEGVTKRFGTTLALDDVSLTVDAGRVLALLGPNGAGKTTLIRVLTTLLLPDKGRARVAGLDVRQDAKRIRSIIGLAGQYATVDELLTGRENLELVGLLYHLDKEEYRRRAHEALERMSLTDAGDKPVRTYSGGMRRRLDLAASLIGRPPVLFLDEPTTGLDPRTRNDLWRFIQDLVSEGTTVLLTTQYMEEAERLADSIIVLDAGRVVARGTADELKDQLGGNVLDIRVTDLSELEKASSIVAELGRTAPRNQDPHRGRAPPRRQGHRPRRPRDPPAVTRRCVPGPYRPRSRRWRRIVTGAPGAGGER